MRLSETLLLPFQIAQFAVIAGFVAAVSDQRKKARMVPLLPTKWIVLMKLCYPVALLSYGYVLITLNGLAVGDWIALLGTSLGTLLVAKAKWDLAASHTFTGYAQESPRLVTHGVYAWVRHPFYTGVYVFSVAACVTMLLHAPWYLTAIQVLVLGYVLGFLATAASVESRFAAERLGDPYLHYRSHVHAFLPLGKYRA